MPRPVLLLAAVTLVAAALALLLSGSPGDAPATNPAGKSEDTTAPVEEVAEDRDAEVTCRVRGLVLDRETHEPVVAAEVRYAVDESTVFSVTTDGEGAWSVCVPGEVPEDNPARVTAPGYLPGTACLDIASEWTLHPPIVLTRLRPVRTMVCGEVVDPEGRPVAGAKVSPDHGVVAVTDTRGEFRDLPWAAERLWLTVVAKGYPTIGKTVDTSFGPAPETRVRIVLPHPVVARGLVVDDLGRPVPGVLLHDDMEDLRRETRTGAGGRFTWLVPRHGYAWLVVEKEGYLLPEDDEEEVMVHASHEVRIVLDRAGVLAGRVLPPPSGERPAGLMVATWAMRTPVEPDGTFRFAAHPSGEGVLSVVRPPEFTSPRHVPPWQVFSESKVSFELRPGEVLDDFVLEVGEVRRATGRILDAVTGRPVVGASVVSGLTDGDGRFEWTVPAAAPEDDLVVEILADGYLPWRGRFAPEIRLMPWREVEIRVTGPDGEPVKGLGLWPDLPLVNAWMI
ncbi:MAG: carboxypeptidase regulatory-like domain-containing protein, partial [Planctomycetota bacterium]